VYMVLSSLEKSKYIVRDSRRVRDWSVRSTALILNPYDVLASPISPFIEDFAFESFTRATADPQEEDGGEGEGSTGTGTGTGRAGV
jgi:hypothetical protein